MDQNSGQREIHCNVKYNNLSSFNTSNVEDMGFMFYECCSLESLNLSSFNTNNIKYMGYMFNKCKNLKSIDLSLFNTNNAYNNKKGMEVMFQECPLKKDNIKINNKEDIIFKKFYYFK